MLIKTISFFFKLLPPIIITKRIKDIGGYRGTRDKGLLNWTREKRIKDRGGGQRKGANNPRGKGNGGINNFYLFTPFL